MIRRPPGSKRTATLSPYTTLFRSVPDDATERESVGQQWQWSFRLPGEDGRLGTAATHHITDTNPLGLNPDDPDGRDDIVVQGSELRLPIGKTVKALLRSVDVLHAFYVPRSAKRRVGKECVCMCWYRW